MTLINELAKETCKTCAPHVLQPHSTLCHSDPKKVSIFNPTSRGVQRKFIKETCKTSTPHVLQQHSTLCHSAPPKKSQYLSLLLEGYNELAKETCKTCTPHVLLEGYNENLKLSKNLAITKKSTVLTLRL